MHFNQQKLFTLDQISSFHYETSYWDRGLNRNPGKRKVLILDWSDAGKCWSWFNVHDAL